MKRQKWMIVVAMCGLLGIAVLVGCGNLSDGVLFPGGGGGINIPLTPAFLVAVDSHVATTATVNVFPIDSTTGELGAAVGGSPFDMGISGAMNVVVHPNGHWIYVADGDDGSIHALDVDTTTGAVTAIGAAVPNESGTYFQPCCDPYPTRVLAITPGGRFLYASNDDNMVSAYSIGSNGALTHIGDFDTGADATGALAATDSFVWVTDNFGGTATPCSGPWNVIALRIGTDGSLTTVGSTSLLDVYCWLWSIAVSPDGKIVQVGDEGGDAQVYSFTVGADGSLTQVGTQVILNSSSDCRDIQFSPDGKFFYATDDESVVHAAMQNADGSFTELGVSPYSGSDGDGEVAVDLSGKFLYTGSSSQIDKFTRDSTTGELTAIGTPTDSANGAPMAVGIIRKEP